MIIERNQDKNSERSSRDSEKEELRGTRKFFYNIGEFTKAFRETYKVDKTVRRVTYGLVGLGIFLGGMISASLIYERSRKEIPTSYEKSQRDSQGIVKSVESGEKKFVGDKQEEIGIVKSVKDKPGLLEILAKAGVVDNAELILYDNDGLVYGAFNNDLETLKKILATPEDFKFKGGRREKLYSTLVEAWRDQHASYIVEFDGNADPRGRVVSEIYDAKTGKPVKLY